MKLKLGLETMIENYRHERKTGDNPLEAIKDTRKWLRYNILQKVISNVMSAPGKTENYRGYKPVVNSDTQNLRAIIILKEGRSQKYIHAIGQNSHKEYIFTRPNISYHHELCTELDNTVGEHVYCLGGGWMRLSKGTTYIGGASGDFGAVDHELVISALNSQGVRAHKNLAGTINDIIRISGKIDNYRDYKTIANSDTVDSRVVIMLKNGEPQAYGLAKGIKSGKEYLVSFPGCDHRDIRGTLEHTVGEKVKFKGGWMRLKRGVMRVGGLSYDYETADHKHVACILQNLGIRAREKTMSRKLGLIR